MERSIRRGEEEPDRGEALQRWLILPQDPDFSGDNEDDRETAAYPAKLKDFGGV